MVPEQPGGPDGAIPRAVTQVAVAGPAAAVLAAAADLLDGLFTAAPVGLALLDPALRVVRVNAELARIVRRDAAAIAGRPAAQVLPEVLGGLAHALAAATAGAEPPRAEVAVGGGADRLHLVVSCFPVRVGGALAGVGVSVADVTPLRAREEVHARLVAIAGHDARTPLAAIGLSAETLLRAGLEPRHRRLLHGIVTSVRRIDRIVADLVDWAVAQRGEGLPMRPGRAHLDQLCRAVAAEAEAAAPGRTVACAGERHVLGRWDAGRLTQAVSNLVSNALRHGDRTAPVEVRWRAEGDAVAIEVWNRGPPIPARDLPGLFEAFRRGGGNAGAGLGLGLFIAREIAAAHGGRLEARSDVAGTVFTLVLPRDAAARSG